MKKQELIEQIKNLKNEMENFEIDPYKHEDAFKDMIDDIDGPVVIAGLKFTASRILEKLDPIAYRCSLNDWVDSLDKGDDKDYQELQEKLEELEADLEDLQSALDEIAEAWESCTLEKMFEIPVTNKLTGEENYIVFDITLEDDQFIARHEPLNRAQIESKFIPCIERDIDPDFSLDENLQELYSDCETAIIDSEFFTLRGDN